MGRPGPQRTFSPLYRGGRRVTSTDINSLCNQYGFPTQPAAPAANDSTPVPAWIQLQDPIIYPGIYSASGIDVMGVLVRSTSRILLLHTGAKRWGTLF